MKLFITVLDQHGGVDYSDTIDNYVGVIPRKGETLVYLRSVLDDHPVEAPISDVKYYLQENKVYVICRQIR